MGLDLQTASYLTFVFIEIYSVFEYGEFSIKNDILLNIILSNNFFTLHL